MNEITHKKARALFQKDADRILIAEERSALESHLKNCKQCQEYAAGFSVLETSLQNTFHDKWDMHKPEKLTPQAIVNPSPGKLVWNFINQTGFMGKATIIVTMLLGYFVIANILGMQYPISDHSAATILPTPNSSAFNFDTSPTPSAQLTTTRSTSQACKTFVYVIQENDTLASIAVQHRTTNELIMEYNGLKSDSIFTGQELIIPICSETPSLTATHPENTVTITPANGGTLFPTQPQ